MALQNLFRAAARNLTIPAIAGAMLFAATAGASAYSSPDIIPSQPASVQNTTPSKGQVNFSGKIGGTNFVLAHKTTKVAAHAPKHAARKTGAKTGHKISNARIFTYPEYLSQPIAWETNEAPAKDFGKTIKEFGANAGHFVQGIGSKISGVFAPAMHAAPAHTNWNHQTGINQAGQVRSNSDTIGLHERVYKITVSDLPAAATDMSMPGEAIAAFSLQFEHNLTQLDIAKIVPANTDVADLHLKPTLNGDAPIASNTPLAHAEPAPVAQPVLAKAAASNPNPTFEKMRSAGAWALNHTPAWVPNMWNRATKVFHAPAATDNVAASTATSSSILSTLSNWFNKGLAGYQLDFALALGLVLAAGSKNPIPGKKKIAGSEQKAPDATLDDMIAIINAGDVAALTKKTIEEERANKALLEQILDPNSVIEEPYYFVNGTTVQPIQASESKKQSTQEALRAHLAAAVPALEQILEAAGVRRSDYSATKPIESIAPAIQSTDVETPLAAFERRLMAMHSKVPAHKAQFELLNKTFDEAWRKPQTPTLVADEVDSGDWRDLAGFDRWLREPTGKIIAFDPPAAKQPVEQKPNKPVANSSRVWLNAAESPQL